MDVLDRLASFFYVHFFFNIDLQMKSWIERSACQSLRNHIMWVTNVGAQNIVLLQYKYTEQIWRRIPTERPKNLPEKVLQILPLPDLCRPFPLTVHAFFSFSLINDCSPTTEGSATHTNWRMPASFGWYRNVLMVSGGMTKIMRWSFGEAHRRLRIFRPAALAIPSSCGFFVSQQWRRDL